MTNKTLQKSEVCAGRTHVQTNGSHVVRETSLPATRQHGPLFGAILLGFVLSFAGCVTSPFLSEDAAERLAAVNALTEQRKLAEVALDYCTEPYQDLPTGCRMDVRIRAVERLTDRDLLMAVASFSIVKTAIKGKSCYVSLGEANAKLKELALDKLTEDKYIPMVLAAEEPFAIQPLFTKAMLGFYQIAGNPPVTAESAWFETVKGKEASVAKSFCSCLAEGVPVELCKRVCGLLPASLSAETQKLVAGSYKRLVTSASDVPDAVRALQLAEVVPAFAVVKGDIDAMCRSVCSKVSSVGEFKAFGTLVNGVAKQYVSDTEGMVKSAATQVVQKLNGMHELADFASVLKPYTNPWVGQIGIEEQVRKCAMSVTNIGDIRTFASQLSFFNEVMLPNKTDIAGDAVIAVLNAVVGGKAVATASAELAQTEQQSVKGRKRGRTNRTSSAQPGQKETIRDFVAAATELPADILSDKAIVAIFECEQMDSAYSRAIRSDGFREGMGNEITGAVMKSGSLGDLLVAGMLMGAMGDKESAAFTKMFARLISVLRQGESFVNAAKYARIYYPRNMLIEEAEKRMDDMTQARCLLAVAKHSPDSSWCINKTLSIGMRISKEGKNEVLSILQPLFMAYVKDSDMLVALKACACLQDASVIKDKMLKVDLEALAKNEYCNAYIAAMENIKNLYNNQSDEWLSVEDALSDKLAKDLSWNGINPRAPFAFMQKAASVMSVIASTNPELWALIMLKVKLQPYSVEFDKVVEVLSGSPSVLVDFLFRYECEPYQEIGAMKEGEPISALKLELQRTYTHVFFYDCEWYPKALCAAATLQLTEQDRVKINSKLQFVAIHALELDVRKLALDAIVGDAEKKTVTDAWEASRADIAKKVTALFNFCMDSSLTKMKKDHVWDATYAHKRMCFRGKVVDVDGVTVVIDGGSDVIGVKNFVEPPTEDELRNQERDLKFAQMHLDRVKGTIESAKRDLARKKVDLIGDHSAAEKKEALEMFHKLARENLASAEKELPEVLAKYNAIKSRFNTEGVKIRLLYSATFSEKCVEEISNLNKGDEIVFEAYPGRIFRDHNGRPGPNRPKDGVYDFHSSMKQARIIKD